MLKVAERVEEMSGEFRELAKTVGLPYIAAFMKGVADNCDLLAAVLYMEYQKSDIPCPDSRDYPF